LFAAFALAVRSLSRGTSDSTGSDYYRSVAGVFPLRYVRTIEVATRRTLLLGAMVVVRG